MKDFIKIGLYEVVADSVQKDWDNEVTDLLFERIKRFAGTLPNTEIELTNDADESTATYLYGSNFYTPAGSRYGSTDEEEQEYVAQDLESQRERVSTLNKLHCKNDKAKEIAKQVVWHLTHGVYKSDSNEQTSKAVNVASSVIINHLE